MYFVHFNNLNEENTLAFGASNKELMQTVNSL